MVDLFAEPVDWAAGSHSCNLEKKYDLELHRSCTVKVLRAGGNIITRGLSLYSLEFINGLLK